VHVSLKVFAVYLTILNQEVFFFQAWFSFSLSFFFSFSPILSPDSCIDMMVQRSIKDGVNRFLSPQPRSISFQRCN
jgi:hypothetical protein